MSKIDIMDWDYLEVLHSDIRKFEKIIDEFGAIEHTGNISDFQFLRLYLYKYESLFIIKYLKKFEVDTSKYEDIYEKLSEKWRDEEKKYVQIIADQLLNDLKDIRQYRGTVEYYFGAEDPDTPEDLWGRDCMEIEIITLRDFGYKIDDILEPIRKLDEKLKKIYFSDREAILEEGPVIEHPYYPDNFWWRHPSKLFSGDIKSITPP